LGTGSRQKDFFDQYELPPLDILADPQPSAQKKIDKLSLERNARLLETVLDDFNVKGEITAVRTGPVVTMYELEPAPGIKASRVIGLADDIARNMSAVSARVSAIPGRTVIASCTSGIHQGMLPISVVKDIAVVSWCADRGALPYLLVGGTTGSGKSVGLNCSLRSLLCRFKPQQCGVVLIDPKGLELKSE